MKLLILGATGPTGHQLVSQALEAGHSVAALARDPRKVTESIEVIEGDATNASDKYVSRFIDRQSRTDPRSPAPSRSQW